MTRWMGFFFSMTVLAWLPLDGFAQDFYYQAPPAGAVTCASENHAYRECRTDFRTPAVLIQNLSRTACLEGRNWGNGRHGTIWVRDGCRGVFMAQRAGGSWPGSHAGQALRCESVDGRRRECRLGTRRGSARLVRQLSNTPCVQGANWGQRGNTVWVDGGCRAEFAVGGAVGAPPNGWGGSTAYTVTCSSENEQAAFCAWDFRRGYPRVIEQLSSAPCQEGSSWGLRGRGEIWVSRGCRARFGVR